MDTSTALQQSIDEVLNYRPDQVAEEQGAYLSSLARLGDSLSARTAVNLDRDLLTSWRRLNTAGFRAKEAEAREDYGDSLEALLHQMIEKHMKLPSPNPTALLTRLKAERPSKYSKDAEPMGTTQAAELLAALRAPKRPDGQLPTAQEDLA